MQKRKRLLFFIPSVLLFSLLFLAIVAFFALEYYATTTVKQEIDNTIEELSKHVLVQYDNLGVNWLAFTVNLEKVKLSKPPLPGMITIDRVSVRDFTSIGIRWIPTVVVFDHIALKNEDATVSIQQLVTTFSLNRIPTQEEAAEDWTVFLDNLRAGNVKLKQVEFSDKTTKFQFDMAEADYAFANGNYRNSNLTINNLKLQQEDLQFHFDNFFLASSLDQNNVVNRVSKKVKNFSFGFPTTLVESNNILQKLTALGYDQLIVGIELEYDYQPETKDLSIAWDASAINLGRLQFDLGLTDYRSPPVPLDGSLVEFLAFLEKLRTPAQEASLQGVKAVYHDFGLVPRLIKAEAQSRGQSSEEFTQNLVGTINTSLLFLPLPASLKEQVYAVNRFLQNPQKIQLTITCKKPLPLKNLEEGSIAGLLDLLENTELKITAK
jgi:hypothetical protein